MYVSNHNRRVHGTRNESVDKEIGKERLWPESADSMHVSSPSKSLLADG